MAQSNKRKFLVIAALHGDEDLGVKVMEKVEKKFPPRKYSYDWIIGNPKAYDKKERFAEADLNRVAPGSFKSKIYEERRASEIVKISSKYEFVLDIHSTVSNSGIVTIIPYPTLENIYLASALNIKRNVIWYSSSSLKKGPLVQFVSCPGIEIECGPKNSPKLKIQLFKILKKFIEESNSLSVQKVLNIIKSKEFYVVYGKETGEHNPAIEDFHPVKNGRETYYPFLANQYPNIICYKMEKVDIKNYFLY